jgi:LysM repeat protein
MTDWAVYTLLALALVVPVLGALLLRLIAERLSEVQGAIVVAVLVGIAITSVLILARSEVTNLGVGSLNVLRPATLSADSPLPAEPTTWSEPPVAFVPEEAAPIVVDTATVTPSSTASAVITSTRTARPTRTTRTPAATATLTPTLTATSLPTTDPTEAVLATLEAIRATQQAAATPTPTPEPPTATPAPTATPEPEPEPPAQQVYVVEPGDTLRGIAEAFGVSVEALLDANGLTPEEGDQIRPGQELIIP